jgi:hypothetical protein
MKLIDHWKRVFSLRRRRRADRRSLEILYGLGRDDLKDIGLIWSDLHALRSGDLLADTSRRQR